MTDMLVKLYGLPPMEPEIKRQSEQGIIVRRALAAEKHVVLKWIGEHFTPHWVSECDTSFSRSPVSCFIATLEEKMIGFACYDVTAKGFFGPTGVGEVTRGRGTGKALFLACLHDMYAQGYGYGIIGGVGPVEFYAKVAGATVIPDSTPGMYADMLR